MATILVTGCDTGLGVEFARQYAGIGRPHPPFGETDYANWRRILEANLLGPMKMAESFVEQVGRSDLKMMAFVSSRMGSIALNNSGGSYSYRSSKAGDNGGWVPISTICSPPREAIKPDTVPDVTTRP